MAHKLFCHPKILQFLMATISLDIAWEGVCVRLATFAPWNRYWEKNKNRKADYFKRNWRFGFDATYIRNVTVIVFEDCNGEGHVASAVYKVWSVTYSKKKGNLKTQDVNRSPNL